MFKFTQNTNRRYNANSSNFTRRVKDPNPNTVSNDASDIIQLRKKREYLRYLKMSQK